MHASETVVVGLDATPGSESALRWAIRVAGARGWSLHLVHGLPAPAAGADDDERDRAAAESYLAETAARAQDAGARDVRWTAAERPAGPVLIETSENAALLVVGARAGGARLRRGGDSVVAHVSRFARCPVAVVPREPRETTGLVAVHVRGTAADRAVLEFAFGHAAATRSELEVIHAWREPEPDTLEFSALVEGRSERLRRASEVLLAELVAGFATTHPDVPVRRTSVPVEPRDALRQSSEQADLLVVAAPDPAVERHSAELVDLTALRHSHCPVVYAR